MPTLSVIIVAHDSRPALAATLPALAAQLRDGDELIVVDNASTDGSAEARRELAPAATVIETGANLGFAAACNRGADAATGELLCLLNPDAVPQPGWRDAIERAGARRPRMGGVAGAGHRRRRPHDQHRGRRPALHRDRLGRRGGRPHRPERRPAERRAEPGFLSGACLAIPRATLYRELGGMPEHFFLYHEDVDLSLRVRLARRRARGRAGALGSTTTTSSTRARPSGATSSATAGRR